MNLRGVRALGGTMSKPFVVVGAGLAAPKAVEALRECGYDGQIVVYGKEHHPPYERPPLSKDYLRATPRSTPRSCTPASGMTRTERR